MASFSGSTTVLASEQALFDYLSELDNLPQYFSRLTSVTRGEGDVVHTTARMPDGEEVAGEAWFRVVDATKTVEWGSEGPSSYTGSLQVSAEAGATQVEVTLHTTRVEAGDEQVQSGIQETLANITRLVDQGDAPQ